MPSPLVIKYFTVQIHDLLPSHRHCHDNEIIGISLSRKLNEDSFFCACNYWSLCMYGETSVGIAYSIAAC